MHKQLFETPVVDVPYFGDFKDREGKKRCKKCNIGGDKWAEFKKDNNIKKHSQELNYKHLNKHQLEHWTEFQMMKELKLTNKNRYGGPNWIELAEKYYSIGELGNFGYKILEICILNTSQVMKTSMGIAENGLMRV